jgi:dolichyl-phosphate-mannose--protein O-mannosyl transferase
LFLIIGSLALASSHSTSAQESNLSKPVHIQAQAMGTSTQMGQSFSVTAIVNELSSPADQQVLLEAFKAKGNEGLVNALSKMPSKGRLAITGTLGGDLAYIRRFQQPDGTTMIRMVTNRLLRFGEVWADTRSSDYQLSGVEVIFSKDKKHNSGVLIPAAELKINKEGHLEVETFQNPWKLVNVQLR